MALKQRTLIARRSAGCRRSRSNTSGESKSAHSLRTQLYGSAETEAAHAARSRRLNVDRIHNELRF